MKLILQGKEPERTRFFTSQILLVMKLTIFLIIIACLQVSATAFSQKITINEKNASIAKVLNSIQEQSGYEFFYNSKAIQQAGTVTLSLKDASVEQALDQLFKDRPFNYTIENKTIVVSQIAPVARETIAVVPQSPPPIIITGRVTNSKGEPLPGVSIFIKNTTKGAITDGYGNY